VGGGGIYLEGEERGGGQAGGEGGDGDEGRGRGWRHCCRPSAEASEPWDHKRVHWKRRILGFLDDSHKLAAWYGMRNGGRCDEVGFDWVRSLDCVDISSVYRGVNWCNDYRHTAIARCAIARSNRRDIASSDDCRRIAHGGVVQGGVATACQ